MFSLKLKLFDFTSLRQGQFLANIVKSHKNQKQKYFNARIHRDPSTSLQASMTLIRGTSPPIPPKAKAKMALASLVSFQKQKLTIAKNFKESDAAKAVFQRGE